jgi:flagellar hook-associated protein FlgK
MRILSELKKILIKNQEKKGYNIYCAASLGYVDLSNNYFFETFTASIGDLMVAN